MREAIFRILNPFVYFIIVGVLFVSLNVEDNITLAQPTVALTAQPKIKSGKAQVDDEDGKIEVRSKRLKDVVTTIELLEKNIATNQQQIEKATSQADKERLTQVLETDTREYNALQKSFEYIVTNAEEDNTSFEINSEELNIENELKALLSPIITELKLLTARPREIERLKTDLFNQERQLKLANDAVLYTNQIVSETQDSAILKKIKKVQENWLNKQQSAKAQLGLIRQKLEQRQHKETSIYDSITQVLRIFFQTKGRNLGLSILFSLIFWLISSRIYSWLSQISYVAEKRKKVPVRIFGILAYLFTIIGTLLAFLISLFILGDWILLVLSSTMLLAAIWTSKNALARFWSTIVILLNMGSIREGEVVIINGILWQIVRLNVYTTLVNPLLTGGTLRLPIAEISKLCSRKKNDAEPWFPTKNNDWITIPQENMFGQVVLQTPEHVVVEFRGGSRRFFRTDSFISLTPNIISNGFRLTTTFGIDYQHQGQLFNEVIPTLQSYIEAALTSQNLIQDVVKINIEVTSASASSLDLAVMIDFNQNRACEWDILKRMLQRLCIEACNKHNWIIPFTQIAVHKAA
jgi:predicted  nucleic acid-binding Zn-ribbon protein